MADKNDGKGAGVFVFGVLFVFYGLPLWALVEILTYSDRVLVRFIISFACLSYFISNIIILGFIGSGDKEKITKAYLLLYMYFFPASIVSLILLQTIGPSQSVNVASASLNIFHGAIVLCIVVKRLRKGQQLYQPKSLLAIFVIGTGFILILPIMIVLLILKIVCPKQNQAPREAQRQARPQPAAPVQAPAPQVVPPAQVAAEPIVPIPQMNEFEPQAQIIQPIPNVQDQPIVIDDKPELKFFEQGNKVNSYLIERQLTHQPTMLKNAELTCSICLEQFENEMNLTVLVKCKHVFHTNCIRDWLKKNKDSCPLCRSSVYAPASWLNKQQ